MLYDVYVRRYVKVSPTQSVTMWERRQVDAVAEGALEEHLRGQGLGEFWAYPHDDGLGLRTYERTTTEVERLR